jgi:hypothetical protein
VITSSDETKNDAVTKGETRSNMEQGKLIEEIRRGKEIHVDVDIMDISNEDEITPMSQLYP